MSASVIGIDLRATKVAVAPLRDGQLGEPLVQPTERSDSATLIDQLAAMVESARTDHLLGIGVPRIVEFETGGVVSTARPAAPSAKVQLICRWPTFPSVRSWESGSAFRCSSTTTPTSQRLPRRTTRSLSLSPVTWSCSSSVRGSVADLCSAGGSTSDRCRRRARTYDPRS